MEHLPNVQQPFFILKSLQMFQKCQHDCFYSGKEHPCVYFCFTIEREDN